MTGNPHPGLLCSVISADSTAWEASLSRDDDHEDLTAELTDMVSDFVYSKVEKPFTLQNVVVTARLKPDTIPGYHRYDD